MVMFPDDEKLGISELENLYKNFIDLEIPKGILIIKNDLTSHARKVYIFLFGIRKSRRILDWGFLRQRIVDKYNWARNGA